MALKKLFSWNSQPKNGSELSDAHKEKLAQRMGEVLFKAQSQKLRKSKSLARIKPDENIDIENSNIDNSGSLQLFSKAARLESFLKTPEQIVSAEVDTNPEDELLERALFKRRHLTDEEFNALISPEVHKTIKAALEKYVRF